MDNNYDFESSEPVSNGPVQNQPKNSGYIPNGYTPNNNYASNNYSQNNGKNGGVPLIAIIGVMAVIILGLIIYIVYQEISTTKTPISEGPTTSLADKTYVEDTTEENVEEDVVVNKDNDVVEDDEDVVDKDVATDKDSEKVEDEEKNEAEDKKSDTGIIATNKQNTTTEELSDDWKSLEFILAGQKYKLNTDYKNLIDNGWAVDFAELGYADGYILNKNDKTYSTTNLENEDYEDADVNIGFINLGESARDVSECQFWAISVDNAYSDTPVDFELPNGIKNGSTLAEVEAAYGIPEDENDIYISDSLGYRVYSYSYDYEIHFDVTISDTDGVTGFDYKIY